MWRLNSRSLITPVGNIELHYEKCIRIDIMKLNNHTVVKINYRPMVQIHEFRHEQ